DNDGTNIVTFNIPATAPRAGFHSGTHFVLGHSTGPGSVTTTFDNLFVSTGVGVKDYFYEVEAIDPDGDPLNYSLRVAPLGMGMDPVTGLIRWSPTIDQIGNHNVTVQVSDGHGGLATQSYVVTVLPDPANHPPIIITQP